MEVRTIQDRDGLLEIRESWERLHALDADSGYFLSWPWLNAVFASYPPGRWKVLTVHSQAADGGIIGILPLERRTRWSESSQSFKTELGPAGKLGWAQYTGFICDPKHEDAAIDAIAANLLETPWARIEFKHDGCKRRIDRLLERFPADHYRIADRPQMINDGTVDNLVCPRIELPGGFDAFLQNCTSSNTRQKIRRIWRQFDADDALVINDSTAETFEADLDSLLGLWQASWEPVRGSGSVQRATASYRKVLAHSHAIGAVEICTLRRGKTPLGALCSIVDRTLGHVYFIVAGRDETVQDINVGLLLHTHNIKRAISRGLTTYDFCHGNEAYKFSYGAQEYRLSNVEITRRSGCEISQLDPAHLGEAMRKTIAMLEGRQTEAAKRACLQILPLIA
ncbi:hypothetical protein CSC94_08735 [Zhengella mangrovi]|uniref:BioF2-like acetyltransferase domain-containing protein n=1 Tax=Zhengella mangrovi TaxID=1982044 RepID=A0A2G1QQI6_9HYPH|nr:GNAT family N-acetyltransferase [Zhengella mangrovi]PHP67762.1 hypothetical protein CSC94_08735 [Zhengella mangrovi]